jgi:hypothetical protein
VEPVWNQSLANLRAHVEALPPEPRTLFVAEAGIRTSRNPGTVRRIFVDVARGQGVAGVDLPGLEGLAKHWSPFKPANGGMLSLAATSLARTNKLGDPRFTQSFGESLDAVLAQATPKAYADFVVETAKRWHFASNDSHTERLTEFLFEGTRAAFPGGVSQLPTSDRVQPLSALYVTISHTRSAERLKPSIDDLPSAVRNKFYDLKCRDFEIRAKVRASERE